MGERQGLACVPPCVLQFYLSRHCALCDELTRAQTPLCDKCMAQPQASMALLQVSRCGECMVQPWHGASAGGRAALPQPSPVLCNQCQLGVVPAGMSCCRGRVMGVSWGCRLQKCCGSKLLAQLLVLLAKVLQQQAPCTAAGLGCCKGGHGPL